MTSADYTISADAVISARTAIVQAVGYSRAIRFNRLDFMNAPKLNTPMRDQHSSRCRAT